MPPIPVLRPREAVAAFQKLGWEVARQRGSHIILTKTGHIATLSVPNHPEVARGTLRALIARAGLTVEEFLRAARG
jgi:predicted RNA binding protein YcfA (HicA-like mRNA interferase family)